MYVTGFYERWTGEMDRRMWTLLADDEHSDTGEDRMKSERARGSLGAVFQRWATQERIDRGGLAVRDRDRRQWEGGDWMDVWRTNRNGIRLKQVGCDWKRYKVCWRLHRRYVRLCSIEVLRLGRPTAGSRKKRRKERKITRKLQFFKFFIHPFSCVPTSRNSIHKNSPIVNMRIEFVTAQLRTCGKFSMQLKISEQLKKIIF